MSNPLNPTNHEQQPPIEVVGFDADDTLWHNEDAFQTAEGQLVELLAPWNSEENVRATMLATERANLPIYGYGAKAFTLSLLETALHLSGGAIPSSAVSGLIEVGKLLLSRPTRLLESAADAVAEVASRHLVVLITKGDLAHQERRVAESGLSGYFKQVHVVSEKDPATYRAILAVHGVAPAGFVMVGNSVRSDLLPIIELGGTGVHIPYHVTWAHEVVEIGDRRRNSDFPLAQSSNGSH